MCFADKPSCRACDIVLDELENIDDDCEIYGINFVKIQDIPLAKRYGIKTYPALIYFRNGNPLIYDGMNRLSIYVKILRNNYIPYEKQTKYINNKLNPFSTRLA